MLAHQVLAWSGMEPAMRDLPDGSLLLAVRSLDKGGSFLTQT